MHYSETEKLSKYLIAKNKLLRQEIKKLEKEKKILSCQLEFYKEKVDNPKEKKSVLFGW
jgi:hypothetical protein